jgi:hypothetical protein
MCEEYQSVHFWIVSSVAESDPYRTEVPVDAGSDIVRPISFFDQDNAASKYSTTKYSCESPVDVMDPDHHRSISSISACTTSASDGATPGHLNHERGWGSSSSDVGCLTGRSHWSCWDDSDADEAGVDSYTVIGEFDSLMKGSLPEIRVIRPYRGRRSLLDEFDFDESSSKTKARTKARGTYQQYEYLADKKAGVFGSGSASSGEILQQSTRFSGFGELKRRIARFMSSKGRDKAKVAGAKEEDRAEELQQKQQDSSDVNDSHDVNEVNDVSDSSDVNDVTRSMNEVSINDTAMDGDATPVCGVVVTQLAEKADEDDEDTGEDRIDFLVMIPQA